jgi:hypothetical protein
MSSIIRYGDTYLGIGVFGRGVFTDEDGFTYAGQHRGGYACGLGVVTWPNGNQEYAEHGRDGKYDGRWLCRWADGHTFYYMFERGKSKDSAVVSADGRCKFNGVVCAPDDPRLLALIAQVAPVEVPRAARATQLPSLHNSSPRDRPMDSFCPRRRWRPPRPPRCSPPRRCWWLRDATQQHPHCKARPHSDAYTGFFCGTGLTGGSLLHPLTTAAGGAPMGPSRQLRYHATVKHAAC